MNIFDSSAVLAYLLNEKGYLPVKKLLKICFQKKESVFIHQINFIEVLYKTEGKFPSEKIEKMLGEFESPWWGKVNYLDTDLALPTSFLKNKYKNISLGDSIGLAYTQIMEGTFWTADKFLKEVGDAERIQVTLIR